ncbi:putative amidase domain protein [compost metagenome]
MNTGAAGQWLYAVPWVQADSFFKLIRSADTIHGYGKPGPEYLYEGDIISYDKGSDYTMNHTAVITNRDTPSTPLVLYHTTNRKNVTWDFYIINTPDSVIPYFTHIL